MASPLADLVFFRNELELAFISRARGTIALAIATSGSDLVTLHASLATQLASEAARYSHHSKLILPAKVSCKSLKLLSA